MQDKKYFIFNKGEKLKLSDNFQSSEFECKCSNKECVEQRVSIDLIESLQKARTALNTGFVVTSGYRCEAHNKAIGGAKSSQHLKGNAADIKTKDMDKLDTELQKHFDAIGDAKPSFLHVDIRRDAKRRWTY